MAVKRVKFLHRVKILQDDIRIRLESRGNSKSFSAHLDLAAYTFPPDARVVVEARQLLETIRFDFGTVASLRPATANDISRLRGERVTFSVLVLEPQGARKLGAAQTIRPNVGDAVTREEIPLLPVEASTGVAPLLWRVDYCDTDLEGNIDAPVLVFDERAVNGSAAFFMQDPAVRAMVLPAAMSEILTGLILVDRESYDASSVSWRNCWLRFGARLTDEDPPSPEEDGFESEAREWIRRATMKLAERASFLDQYLRSRER